MNGGNDSRRVDAGAALTAGGAVLVVDVSAIDVTEFEVTATDTGATAPGLVSEIEPLPQPTAHSTSKMATTRTDISVRRSAGRFPSRLARPQSASDSASRSAEAASAVATSAARSTTARR